MVSDIRSVCIDNIRYPIPELKIAIRQPSMYIALFRFFQNPLSQQKTILIYQFLQCANDILGIEME